jgi:ribonuclease HI
MHYLFTDGGSRGNPGNAACAFLIFDDNKLIDIGGKYLAHVTNNVAEYNGLIAGLKQAKKLEITELKCFLDSELVVKQINGEYKVSNDDMKKLVIQVKELSNDFQSIQFTHVLREKNKHADKMVNVILDSIERI